MLARARAHRSRFHFAREQNGNAIVGVDPFRGTLPEVVSGAKLLLHIVERHIVCAACLGDIAQFALTREIASESFARNRSRLPQFQRGKRFVGTSSRRCLVVATTRLCRYR